MIDVFISYSRADRQCAESLAAALARRGWSVWWDHHIVPGALFRKEIDDALASARCVVVVWSPASVGSMWVQAEADHGLRRGILVPVAIGRPSPPLPYSAVQTLDFDDWSGGVADPVFLRLCKAVELKLGSASAAVGVDAVRAASAGFVHGVRTDPPQAGRSGSVPKRLLVVGLAVLICTVAFTSLTALRNDSPPEVASEAQPPPHARPDASSEKAGQSALAVAATAPAAELNPPRDRSSDWVVLRDCERCPELVVIPPGRFTMGSARLPEPYRDAAGPPHEVRLSNRFAMGRSEVSRREFAWFVSATGYKTDVERGAPCRASTADGVELRHDRNWKNPGFRQQDDSHPAVCLSWNDAKAYLGWLNALVPSARYRLPSEAEWEYVARSGESVALFPWGDDPRADTVCAFANVGDVAAEKEVPRFALAKPKWTTCSDHFPYTAPAKAFGPNAFGTYNAVGNVWEWVEDTWHPSYAGAPADGSPWISGGDSSLRVYRGGSWANHPMFLSPAFRANAHRSYAEESIGFRVARSIKVD